MKKLFFITLLFLYGATFFGAVPANASKAPFDGTVDDAVELSALKALYDSLGGTNWTSKTNWPAAGSWPATAASSVFATWEGVTVTNGDVTKIDLAENNLTGFIPTAIGDLVDLETVYLHKNSVGGSLPASIGNLTKAKYFYVYDNNLGGNIPSEIGNMSAMLKLYLYDNFFTGLLPDALGNLSNLTHLQLQNNASLDAASIPAALGNLTKLKWLYLNNTNRNGALPNWTGQLPLLQRFFFGNNNYSAQNIPSWIYNLTNIEYLDADYANLTGSISEQISNLTKLYNFDFSDNDLSGSLPTSLGNMSSIYYLNLDNNNFSGTINWSNWGLTSIRNIYLNDNNLEGDLPANLNHLPSLKYFYIDDNNFTTIPDFSAHPNLSSMTINLVRNKMNFATLESLFNGVGSKIRSAIYYAPQNDFSAADTTYSGTGAFHLVAPAQGAQSQHTWWKQNTNLSWTEVSAQNESAVDGEYYIASADSTVLGTYKVLVSNNWITDLNIQSVPFQVTSATVSIPMDPTEVVATMVGSNRVDLTWTDNANSETGYYIDRKLVADAQFVRLDTTLADVINYSDTTVVPGDYQYRISAFNASGASSTVETLSVNVPVGFNLLDDHQEFLALKALYDSTNGAAWTNNTGWPTAGAWPATATAAEMDAWFGITVGDGDVTEIELSQNNLLGGLPEKIKELIQLNSFDINNNLVDGTIPTFWPELTNLKGLNLSFNKFTGTMPSEIGNTVSLESLDLKGNIQLSEGPIPDSFQNLINLKTFSVYSSKRIGTLPSWIGNFSQLEILKLANNNFTADNFPTWLFSLANLKLIEMQGIKLAGPIPDNFSALPNLYYIDLGQNNLNGNIPESLTTSNELLYLYLYGNEFSGQLDISNWVMPNLKYLYLYDNEFIGAFPDDLNKFATLNRLRIQGNNFTDLPNLSNHPNIVAFEEIFVSENLLNFKALEKLFDITGSRISNAIFIDSPQKNTIIAPIGFTLNNPLTVALQNTGAQTTITWLKDDGAGGWTDVTAQNQSVVSGTFEITTPDASHAGTYKASMSNAWATGMTIETDPFTVTQEIGSVHDHQEFLALKALYDNTDGANWNNNTGWPAAGTWPSTATAAEMDAWFGITVVDGDVTEIKLSGNNLEGTIPVAFSNLKKLEYIYFYNNKLTGSIPLYFDQFLSLSYLNLGINRFTGDMPEELGNITSLTYLSLYDNKTLAAGPIPDSYQNLTSLVTLALHSSSRNGDIPAWIGNQNSLQQLYLGGNNFNAGPIPGFIFDLPELSVLQIYSTNRTGAIPDLFNNTPALVNLHLGKNTLTGPIPASLRQLPALQYLDLHENSLEGNVDLDNWAASNLKLVSIGDNNFTGTLATDLNHYSNLYEFKAANNNLEIIPDFKSHNNLSNLKIEVQNNRLGFFELEKLYTGTNIPIASSSLLSSPQKNTIIAPIGFTLNNPLTIPLQNTGAQTTITWLKDDGAGGWTDVTVQNQSVVPGTFEITTPDASHAGTYKASMSSAWVTGMTIETDPFTVTQEIGSVPDHQEFLALKALYDNTDGANWTNNTGWPTAGAWPATATAAEMDAWFGITVVDGDVTELRYKNNNLTGTLPLELNQLQKVFHFDVSKNNISGTIPTYLDQFPDLKNLYLGSNDFTGEMPAYIGNIVGLEYLYLNTLSLDPGPIPASFTNLINLKHLAVHQSVRNGIIPSWIGSLNNLVYLTISDNGFDAGPIPSFLFDLPALQLLYVNGTNRTGAIPDLFSQYTQLNTFSASDNQLTGSVPSTLQQSASLSYLYLQNNQLSGELSLENWVSTDLNVVYFYNNQLEGQLPNNLDNQLQLYAFDVKKNAFTTVPDFSNHPNLGNLIIDVRYNQMPFGELEKLYTAGGALLAANTIHLDNQYNTVVTPIGFTLNNPLTVALQKTGAQTTITWLKDDGAGGWTDVTAQNQSVVPGTFEITTPDASHAGTYKASMSNAWATGMTIETDPFVVTQEIGSVPDHQEFLALKALYDNTDGANWTNNTGWPAAGAWPLTATATEMDAWFGITSTDGDITKIKLSQNNLVGPLPNELVNLAKMDYFLVYGNQLNGSIPSYFDGFSELYFLSLGSNAFTGDLPSSIGNIATLRQLFLHNLLSLNEGAIPVTYGNLTSLEILYMSNSKRTGEFPSWIGNLTQLTQLQLNNNVFAEGPIPNGIGNLVNVVDLQIYGTHRNGNIPDIFGGLTKIQTLHLSSNKLTGTVPPSVYNLPALKRLYLHANQLSGNFDLTSIISPDLVEVYLYTNGFTGELTANLDGKPNFNQLRVATNNFVSIPDFSNHPNLSNITIDVRGNQMPFGALEKLYGAGGVLIPANTINLDNQQNIAVAPIGFTLNNPLTVALQNTGAQTTITWLKDDGAGGWTDVTAQNQSVVPGTFEITTPDASHAGTYKASMSNAWVTGMTIETDPFVVTQEIGIVPDHQEFLALKALYDNTDGANWTNNTGWPTAGAWPATATAAEMAAWHGITVVDGDVFMVKLESNNLTGNLPSELFGITQVDHLGFYNNNLSGTFPTGIAGLNKLTLLDITSNDFTGPMPAEIGSVTSLQRLKMSYNGGFDAGAVPDTYQNLVNLVNFSIYSTNRTGVIPSWLSNYIGLKTLMLGENNFDEQPFPVSIFSMPGLASVYINNCNIKDIMPDQFAALPELTVWFAGHNQLSGEIPPSFKSLSKLKQVRIQGSLLTGDLNFHNWASNIFTEIIFPSNDFNAVLDENLDHLLNLKNFHFYDNPITRIPEFKTHPNLANLTIQVQNSRLPFGELEKLYDGPDQRIAAASVGVGDQKNTIVAPVDFEIGGQLKVSILNPGVQTTATWFKDNGAGGWIDVTASNESAVVGEYLVATADASHAGTYKVVMTNAWIPGKSIETDPFTVSEEIGMVSDHQEFLALKALYESTDGANWTDNTGWPASGAWPATATAAEMAAWHGITVVDGDVTEISLGNNNMVGPLPVALSGVQKLNRIYFYNNLLNGVFPDFLDQFPELLYIGLGANKFTGDIPAYLGNMTQLISLGLQYARDLNPGPIPNSYQNLINLETLSIENGKFTGPIPNWLGNMKKLRYLYLSGNNFDAGPIPSFLFDLPDLNLLYLYSTNRTGQVPDLFHLTPNLIYVHIGDNDLIGELPNSFKQLSKLQNVYLQDNQLEGPLELENWGAANLKILYAYDNNFTGALPATLDHYGSLGNFRVQNNNFSSIPDFKNHPNLAALNVFVENNQLPFAELEKLFTAPDALIAGKSITYAPQKNQIIADQQYEAGVAFAFSLQGVGINTTVTWLKDNGAGGWTDVTADNESAVVGEYKITNPDASLAGTFKATMTNAWIPGKSIETDPFEIIQGLAAPSNLSAVLNSNGTVDLTWTDNSNEEEGFVVELKKDNGSFELLTELPANSSSYSHIVASTGTYTYRVASKAASVFSAFSNEASIQNDVPVVPLAANLLLKRNGERPEHDGAPRSIALDQLLVNNVQPVFANPCKEGSYYVVWQLRHDLIYQDQAQDWTANITIELLNASNAVIWEKPLALDANNKTLLSSIVDNLVLSCNDNYSFRLKTKNTTGSIVESTVYLDLSYFPAELPAFNIAQTFTLHTASVKNNCDGSGLNTALFNIGTLETGADLANKGYDFEYVFIDDEDGFVYDPAVPSGPFDYKEPVNRRVFSNTLEIPLHYPKGWVYVRAKAYGESPDYPGFMVNSNSWVYLETASISLSDGHQNDKNWQISNTFAEEGKYKQVVSYFDGSLKNRQTLTNLNTDKTTLVAETFYDYEGRPSVNVLPSPIDCESLEYVENLNPFAANASLPANSISTTKIKYNYDNDAFHTKYLDSDGVTEIGLTQNSVLSAGLVSDPYIGAGRYYSPSNDISTEHKDYIPNAEGFAYTQTMFANDNSGKVVKQGGVGATFAIDGDRSIRYFYAGANQTEMRRLFGSNVGKSSHYKKNAVLDANHQMSISYVDQEGRTIATALAGSNPTNLDALPELTNLPNDLLEIDLANENLLEGSVFKTKHTFIKDNNDLTDYFFNYKLNRIESEIEAFDCENCNYELRITLYDATGQTIDLTAGIEGDSYVEAFDLNCLESPGTGIQLGNGLNTAVKLLDIGEYTLVKELRALDVTYEELYAMISQTTEVQERINAIRSEHVVDVSDCDFCGEPECVDDEIVNEKIITALHFNCNQILEEIRLSLEESGIFNPDQSDYKAHPDYTAYEICQRDIISDKFDLEMFGITKFSEIEGHNYPQTERIPHTGIINFLSSDPYFYENPLNANGDPSDDIDDPTGLGYLINAGPIEGMEQRVSNLQINLTDEHGRTAGEVIIEGSIGALVDPWNTAIYIDDEGYFAGNNPQYFGTGQKPVFHPLYFDFMQKIQFRLDNGEITQAEFDAESFEELDKNSWTLYLSYYREAKRKLKKQIYVEVYNSLRAAKNLDVTDDLLNNFTTSDQVSDLRDQEGRLVPTDGEIESFINSLYFQCEEANLTFENDTEVALGLKDYFTELRTNGNYMMSIRSQDLDLTDPTGPGTTHPSLIPLLDRAREFCDLNAIAVEDPMVCEEWEEITYNDPKCLALPDAPIINVTTLKRCGNNNNRVFVTVENNDPEYLYNWSIENGTIVGGFGTGTIEVELDANACGAGLKVSASVFNCLCNLSSVITKQTIDVDCSETDCPPVVGCTPLEDFTIQGPNVIQRDVITGPGVEEVSFYVIDPKPNFTYTWNFVEVPILRGQGTDRIYIDPYNLSCGNYNVEVVATNECLEQGNVNLKPVEVWCNPLVQGGAQLNSSFDPKRISEASQAAFNCSWLMSANDGNPMVKCQNGGVYTISLSRPCSNEDISCFSWEVTNAEIISGLGSKNLQIKLNDNSCDGVEVKVYERSNGEIKLIRSQVFEVDCSTITCGTDNCNDVIVSQISGADVIIAGQENGIHNLFTAEHINDLNKTYVYDWSPAENIVLAGPNSKSVNVQPFPANNTNDILLSVNVSRLGCPTGPTTTKVVQVNLFDGGGGGPGNGEPPFEQQMASPMAMAVPAVLTQEQMDAQAAERAALIDFYNATEGDLWVASSRVGWKDAPLAADGFGVDISTWNGITTNFDGFVTHVANISTINSDNSGAFPLNLTKFQHLNWLILGFKRNSNFKLPVLSEPLENIEKINLQGISGKLEFLCYMPNLNSITIDYNNEISPMPACIEDMVQLLTLSLNRDRPFEDAGAVIDFSKLVNLNKIDLSGGNYSGVFPKGLANLTNLKTLNLSYNNFTGVIPDLSGSTEMHTLNLNLCSKLDPAPIPSWINSLKKLTYLNLYLTQRIGLVPELELPELTYFSIGNNPGLSAQRFPEGLSNSSNITGVVINNTNRIGTIPLSYGRLTKLNNFDCSDNPNKTPEEVPAFFSQQDYYRLLLRNCAFIGNVPSLNVHTLDLSLNNIRGGLGNVSVLNNSGFIKGNKLSFEDILPYLENNPAIVYSNNESNINSLYQQNVGEAYVVFVAEGAQYTLSTEVDVSLKDNPLYGSAKYRWYKNGNLIPGKETFEADNHILNMGVFTSEQQGVYHYEIIHDNLTTDGVPDVILRSEPITYRLKKDNVLRICKRYGPNYDSKDVGLYQNPINLADMEAQCLEDLQTIVDITIEEEIDKYIDLKITEYLNALETDCFSHIEEDFSYSYKPTEYHYTLYYYDQAGNLVQTVPPAGVKPLTNAQLAGGQNIEPAHELKTRYQYNSLNQLIWQNSPDGGTTKFYYDDAQRLTLSQNAQQRIDSKLSYTVYDAQARIVEVGEMSMGSQSMAEIEAEMQSNPFFPMTGDPANGIQYVAYASPTDITRTHYDLPDASLAGTLEQENLRTRVSWVETMDDAAQNNNNKTHYTYDAHGNVTTVLQSPEGLSPKRLDYVYDLISGNVNYAMYQFGAEDQFIHHYEYDADNRISVVETTTDRFVWNKEAEYTYYAHGPLARTTLGHYDVQGLDYVYTLQGWIKGVNMPMAGDPGADGTASNLVARDAFAYTLGYFDGDYKAIGSNIEANMPGQRDQMWLQQNLVHNNSGLYNGNIAWMATDLPGLEPANRYQGMLYQYDQLNRIKAAKSLTNYDPLKGFGGGTGAYNTSYSYDGNGNLLTLNRNDKDGVELHNFNYHYYKGSNRLKMVQTPEMGTNFPAQTYNNYQPDAEGQFWKAYESLTTQQAFNMEHEDSEWMVAQNSVTLKPGTHIDSKLTRITVDPAAINMQYEYDEIGNLVRDNEEGVSIEWTPYGKVKQINKDDGSAVRFAYDAAGNRVLKAATGTDGITKNSHYLRDASGNVMAIYEGGAVKETPIYGSSRLGHLRGEIADGQRKLGQRSYELSNHLGNVLTVVSDYKSGTADGQGGQIFEAEVLSTSDYYPFGLAMEGRSQSSDGYRYGFNGKEKDTDKEWGSQTHYDYGFRIYNPAIAKFLSVDPLTQSYPMLTPYQFASNRPIDGIDLDGQEWVVKIYSPNISVDFVKALNLNDIHEQRRLTYWALNNYFKDDWVEKNIVIGKLSEDRKVAEIFYDPSIKGVDVYTYSYENKDINKGKILNSTIYHFSPIEGAYPDATYPVDVRATKEYEKVFGSFYGENDFVGDYSQSGMVAIGGKGAGIIQGYVKGYGYSQFTYQFQGVGFDVAVSGGSITGKYAGPDKNPTPSSLEGAGYNYSEGILAWESGRWIGYDNSGNVIWYGFSKGTASGVLPLSKTEVTTETQLKFPKPQNKE